jgi:rod shape determining protein RodA
MFYRSLFRINWKSFLFPWQQIDWALLWVVMGVTTLGGIAIRSTEMHQASGDWWQHLLGGVVGFGLVLWIARSRYENLLQWQWIVYGITNALLLSVILFGTEVNGAKSWIVFTDAIRFQPSEFAKIGLIITLAAVMQGQGASSLGIVLRVLVTAFVPFGLIMAQPDLGTALVFSAVTLGMLYWGNANPGWLVLLVSPVVSAILFGIFLPGWFVWVAIAAFLGWKTLPWGWVSGAVAAVINLLAGGGGKFVWEHVLKDYQRDRLALFMNPDQDALGSGYHLIQSRIAIGAGQLFGRGLTQGTQTQLSFIPEQDTDFIFSAIGEEMGFVGCLLVLFSFWFICLRLVIIAQNSKDNFGSLLAIGVLAMIVFQVLINVGMTIGLAPVTGIPLPWLSSGRSSLLTNFIALGIVESVMNYRQRSGLRGGF